MATMTLQEYQTIRQKWDRAKLAQARIEGELKNLKDTAKRTYGVNSLKELEEKAKQTNELVEKLNKEIDQDLEEIENLMKGTQ